MMLNEINFHLLFYRKFFLLLCIYWPWKASLWMMPGGWFAFWFGSSKLLLYLLVFWSLIIGWYCFLFDYQEGNGLVDLWWVSSTVDGILSKWIEFLLSKRRRKLCIQQRIIIMNEWNWFLWIQLKGVCKPSSQIFNFTVDIT